MLAMAFIRPVEDGTPYHNEFRIVAPAGHVRWIANLGQAYRDDEGRPLRMIGVVHDVTDRKLTEGASASARAIRPDPRRRWLATAPVCR
jgi:PAS domain S-box-containing protein